MVRASSVAFMLLGGLLLSAGCRESTRIVMSISTDVPCTEVRRTTIAAGKADGPEDLLSPATETEQCTEGTIGDITLVPETGASGDVVMRVVLGVDRPAGECTAANNYGGCIVARRRLRYVANTRLLVPVRMYLVCKDVACDAQSTCNKLGRCVPATLSSDACQAPEGCAIEGEDPTEPISSRDAGREADASTMLPGTDAAADAAGLDGGSLDAGSRDADSDAGADSGGTDAGADSGGKDSGADSGAPDAGGGNVSIACGGSTCVQGQKCCFDGVASQPTGCVSAAVECPDITLECDTANDCAPPAGCCFDGVRATCATSCNGAAFICRAFAMPSVECPPGRERCGNPTNLTLGTPTCQ